MSNAHTIKAHRVQPFNQKLPQNSICWNDDLLSGISTSHKMRTLARKWCWQHNPHTLRIRLSIDVVFYIFKISHKHAVFRFRLSSRAVAPWWVLSWKEWREMIIHTRVMGGPSIIALSRPWIPQEVFASSRLGSWLIYLFSKYQFELWYVKSLFLMLWIPWWQ